MAEDHRDFPKIIETLKENPRGMSVKQISEAIGINRISVGHYLEIMLILGQVDMESYGQAKVFYISKRVPIFAMMDFTSDSVLVVSDDCTIVRANKKFLQLTDSEEEKLEGLSCFDIFERLNQNIEDSIKKAANGSEIVEEILIEKNGDKYYFKLKIIPTVFNEGSPGFTIILEDITNYKRSIEALKESETKLRVLVQNLGKFMGIIEEFERLNADIRNPLQAIVGVTDLEGGETASIVYDQAVEIDKTLREIDIGWKEAENIREFIKKYAEINVRK